MAAGAPAVSNGEELKEFETEHLGFRALAQGSEGAKKLKLLPNPWPTDRLPPASATLLSIASQPGLIAAAGPDALVIARTEKVRKAFNEKAGEGDVVTDFTPDVTIPLDRPPLRHVKFSSGGDYLVVSAEGNGGLAVFEVADLLAGKQNSKQIPTDSVPVRVLAANPVPEMEQYMSVVLDTGKLAIVDVNTEQFNTIRDKDVTCVTWSSRGKAVAAGLKDGSTCIYMSDGSLRGTIPRPDSVDDGYEVTGIVWIKNTELLIAHGSKAPPGDDEPSPENKYHIVKCNKTWEEFEFRSTPWDPLMEALEPPPRAGPSRFSAIRLQGWKPDLDDMLIITTSHTDSIALLTSSSKPLAAAQSQEECNEWVLTNPEDSKKAAVPRMVFGDEGDSVFIGEAIDLSATEKLLRPIPALEEISEAPYPLPAYMALTHQGVLTAYWIMWNRSIEQGTCYPGLIAGDQAGSSTATAAVPSSPAPTPGLGQSTTPANKPAGTGVFGKSASTFGSPSIPSFGAPGLGSTPPFLPKSTQPAFGSTGFGSTTPAAAPKPAQPTFGSTGFGSTTPAAAKPAQPTFGSSGFGSTTPATQKPTQPTFGSTGFGTTTAQASAPAFGSASVIGGAKSSGFGAVGGMGNKPSPWASASKTESSPFSAAAGPHSGFAKFGQTGATSSFSSFGSNNSGQSGFGNLGQNQQKSAFPGLKTEPSVGSTITIGSGTGSTLPSWANTPAQQGSIFGQSKSSFNTSSFESVKTDSSEAESRKRDEATPTPQPANGLFGLAGGFKLGTTFTNDGTAKDDAAKPAAPSTGSFFGSDFASNLGGSGLKPPATPAKEAPKDMSTTPASPPRAQKALFGTATSKQESATPKAPPPVKEAAPTDDAPLPPDFLTTKPPPNADDDLPPLAGSPGVKVEAPSSSVEASPIDNEDGDDEDDFSVEEDDEEEDVQQAPVGAQQKSQAPKSGWSFQDSVNQSLPAFPPAPTPPVAKSTAPTTFGRAPATTQSALFGQASKPAQAGPLFGQAAKSPFSLSNQTNQSATPAKPFFPPPANRTQENLRSPSPVRSASTSALRARRDPITAPGASLSASVQKAKTPTPPPQTVDLEDEEDDRMRAQLASAIEPSRALDEFIAYQNYSGKSPSKTGHAAQIEMLYKDINGMIDGLGWNARSIKSFTQYHKDSQPGHYVDQQVLADIESEGRDGSWFEQWTIGEIGALRAVENELERDLEEGRVQDVLEKLNQLARLLHEKAKLMTRLNDIRRQIINRKDPDKVEASRKAPLTKEAADAQKNLRIEYANLLKLLAQAEEGSMLLRSRLVAHNAQQGKVAGVPTVDAVKKTINKMTSLAEKHNNDITLMESQVRKLGMSSPTRPSSSSSRTMGTPRRSRGTSLRNSVAESPFAATPPTNRFKLSLRDLDRRALTPEVEKTPTNKGYGLAYSPDSSPSSGNELTRLAEQVEDNMDSLRETAKRRRQVTAGLKKALLKRGVKTTQVS